MGYLGGKIIKEIPATTGHLPYPKKGKFGKGLLQMISGDCLFVYTSFIDLKGGRKY